MNSRHLLLPAIALALASCEAGEPQTESAFRAELIGQCERGAANAGVAAERIPGVCECSADRLIEGGATDLAAIDRARVEEILSICIEESGTVAMPAAAE